VLLLISEKKAQLQRLPAREGLLLKIMFLLVQILVGIIIKPLLNIIKKKTKNDYIIFIVTISYYT